MCPNKTTGIAADQVQLVQYCNLPLLLLWWGKNMWFAEEAELWCCYGVVPENIGLETWKCHSGASRCDHAGNNFSYYVFGLK